ncbi:MAG: dihydrolipoamide acetyltransferase family protein [Candidatus Bathyarchaeia archaeon]
MSTEIRMPKYGWTMTEGKIIRWLKKEGEHVEEGEPLYEIETEKVETEVESITTGFLQKILAAEGAVVPVGHPIGIISESEEKLPETSYPTRDTEGKPSEEKMPQVVKVKSQIKDKLRASPLAKKIAKQHDINLSALKGSGPAGRIVKEDVVKIVQLQKKGLEKKAPRILKENIIPLEGAKKIIAHRMAKSAHTTARVLYTIDVDMNEVLKLRKSLFKEFQEKANVHLSLTDVIAKAVSKALEQNKILNSILLEDGIHLIEEINLGIAVALENNLLVPVVQSANKKSLLEIAIELNRLIERARKGELTAEDTSNGTFTITNPGMFGVDIQMPVINPPESGILGIGNLCEKPVVRNGQVVPTQMMKLNLVFDHRVLDGVPAAKFLQTLKNILENPYVLLV